AGVPSSSVKERNLGFGLVPGLLTKKVDAVLGAFWNYEGVDLKRRDRNPRIIRVDDAGVPAYNELVIVANEDAIERDGGSIRAFIGALSRGVRDLQDDPDGAIDGLLEANRDLDPGLQRAVLKTTLPLFSAPRGEPFAWQDPRQWDAFAAWMRDNRLLERAPDVSGAFTNELLPGAGLAQ
ncbi:MAG: ABC transporter substrate-binding protein, partial [Thermoleophilaceae bacterium]|nr:ABC transporter substrate-binding protein [Thermoleophilaceae bacterium]